MLYQPQRFSFIASLRKLVAAAAGLFGEIGKTNRDTTYVEGLNEFQLRDLGLNRVDREIRRMHF